LLIYVQDSPIQDSAYFCLMIIFFTGATSGLGRAAVMELAAAGHEVLFTARSQTSAEQLIAECAEKHPGHSNNLKPFIADFNSLKSLHRVCQEIKSGYTQLDIIVSNAGIWNFSFKESDDGIEQIFQVNVLAPALLKRELCPLLKGSASARLIQTASALHQGTLNFNDIEFRKNFSGFKAYRQSKLAIILLSRLWAKELASDSIHVYSQHPGLVDTKLGRDAGWFSNLFFRTFGISPQEGAKTLLHLVNTPNQHLTNGEFYAKCKVKKITSESYDMAMAAQLQQVVNTYLEKALHS
jgi:retinol dehydrogenase 12